MKSAGEADCRSRRPRRRRDGRRSPAVLPAPHATDRWRERIGEHDEHASIRDRRCAFAKAGRARSRMPRATRPTAPTRRACRHRHGGRTVGALRARPTAAHAATRWGPVPNGSRAIQHTRLIRYEFRIESSTLADRIEYEERVRNFTGGSSLTLQIVSRDGQVCIALWPTANPSLQTKCLLETDEAVSVIEAMTKALS